MSLILLRANILLIIVLMAASAASAQSAAADAAERPRVSLVLGGGGARGAAHVGVLKELERLRIPIDAISGTSMGAIVGSLYASGKSPAELEMLVGSIDWADAFVDSTRRQELSFRRKQDDAVFPVQLGLEYATTFGADNQVQDFFPLGGFLRLSGLERGRSAGHTPAWPG